MDNYELIHLLRRAARLSRESTEEGRFGMPPPPPPLEGMEENGPCRGGHGPHGPGGHMERPHRERERVLSLPEDTVLYSGHTEETTVKEERSLYL